MIYIQSISGKIEIVPTKSQFQHAVTMMRGKRKSIDKPMVVVVWVVRKFCRSGGGYLSYFNKKKLLINTFLSNNLIVLFSVSTLLLNT